MEIKAEYRTIFAGESKEHLEQWEQALLNLEREPENEELIHQMFRAIHTLKGSAGFIGFAKLQRVCHDLESALQEVRDGTVHLGSETVDLLFGGLDLCTRMVASFTAGQEFVEDIEGYLGKLWAQHRQTHPQSSPPPGSTAETDAAGEKNSKNLYGPFLLQERMKGKDSQSLAALVYVRKIVVSRRRMDAVRTRQAATTQPGG